MAGLAKHNQIESLRPYILFLMTRDGRDFTVCELCEDDIDEETFEIHHTRYDGATYYDLRIVCTSCNRKAENLLLN
jgi:hypothetical protein